MVHLRVAAPADLGDWSEFRGALAQLTINLISIVAAGIAARA